MCEPDFMYSYESFPHPGGEGQWLSMPWMKPLNTAFVKEVWEDSLRDVGALLQVKCVQEAGVNWVVGVAQPMQWRGMGGAQLHGQPMPFAVHLIDLRVRGWYAEEPLLYAEWALHCPKGLRDIVGRFVAGTLNLTSMPFTQSSRHIPSSARPATPPPVHWTCSCSWRWLAAVPSRPAQPSQLGQSCLASGG